MIGAVVVYPESSPSAEAVGPDHEFLGAPLIARAVAAAVAPEQLVRVVVALPADKVDLARDVILPRFGLEEVSSVYAIGATLVETLSRGLEELGEEAELVVFHDGRRPLVTQQLITGVIETAAERGAAAPAVPVEGSLVSYDDPNAVSLIEPRAALLQTPQAARPLLVRRAIESGRQGVDLATLLMADGASVAFREGDPDNLLIRDEVDVARCIEVWARRAVDFPFLWPRPEDEELDAATNDDLEEPPARAGGGDVDAEVGADDLDDVEPEVGTEAAPAADEEESAASDSADQVDDALGDMGSP